MVGELLVDYLLADAENFQSSKHSWAISSGGEHYLDTVGVTSSNLVSPTMNPRARQSAWLFCFPQNPLEATKAMPHHRDAFRYQDKPRPPSPGQEAIAAFLIAKKVMKPSSERASHVNVVVPLSAPPIRCGIPTTSALPMQNARWPSVMPTFVQPLGKPCSWSSSSGTRRR